MKLDDFISETLVQIINGIKIAQDHARANDAIINGPNLYFSNTSQTNSLVMYDSKTGRLAERIEFDVAITTIETDDAKGGIGIFVGPIGVGAQGNVSAQNSLVNRIKFSVPVILPIQY